MHLLGIWRLVRLRSFAAPVEPSAQLGVNFHVSEFFPRVVSYPIHQLQHIDVNLIFLHVSGEFVLLPRLAESDFSTAGRYIPADHFRILTGVVPMRFVGVEVVLDFERSTPHGLIAPVLLEIRK